MMHTPEWEKKESKQTAAHGILNIHSLHVCHVEQSEKSF